MYSPWDSSIFKALTDPKIKRPGEWQNKDIASWLMRIQTPTATVNKVLQDEALVAMVVALLEMLEEKNNTQSTLYE